MKEVSVEEAWSRKYPERVALAVSVDKEGNSDIITLGWSMITSIVPPMLAISVGKTRYSHKLIFEGKEFVYVIPSIEMKEACLYCGTHSGRNVDKVAETGLKTMPSKLVKPPLIEGASINMECKLVKQIETGDHTIFVGEIVASYVSEKEKKNLLTVGKGYKFGSL